VSSRSAARDLLPSPAEANPATSQNPATTDHRHPERSEGSAFYDEIPRPRAKRTKTSTALSFSSRHGFSPAKNKAFRKLPLARILRKPSFHTTAPRPPRESRTTTHLKLNWIPAGINTNTKMEKLAGG
jgi:hypothetical protein